MGELSVYLLMRWGLRATELFSHFGFGACWVCEPWGMRALVQAGFEDCGP